MSEALVLSSAPVSPAMNPATEVLPTRTELAATTAGAALFLSPSDEVQAAIAAVLVRYAEVMARLADA